MAVFLVSTPGNRSFLSSLLNGSSKKESRGSKAMKTSTDETHSIVSDRLRFVDTLVKAGRISEAVGEVAHIKQIDPANPYVQAYEERLQTIAPSPQDQADKASIGSVDDVSHAQRSPAPPAVAEEKPRQELTVCETGEIEDWLRSAEQRLPAAIDSSDGMKVSRDPRSSGKASIVLVDDDELLLTALVELLEDNKYTTKSFTKSEDALEYVKGHRPDLVLCDVNIQNSSYGGFTLFEKMAKLGHCQNVPFIFLSGLADEAIVRAGKELGADDYLAKPIQPEMLLSVIKGKLRKYKLAEKNH
jgi:CheY-like chemotaxis protein